MKIYEIKNIDCNNKKERIILVKEVMKVLKTDKKPEINELKEICKKIDSKYGIRIKYYEVRDRNIQVNIEFERGSHSIFYANSRYELFCKFILIAKELLKQKRMIEYVKNNEY
mgnify:CR=1 FL=1